MEEIWKDIQGYEGLYQVSNLGRVKSLKRLSNDRGGYRTIEEKIKNTRSCRKDYQIINLSKNGTFKTYRLHRLVAETFIPNHNNYPQVNHIDGNKQNNCVSNLEWCNNSYNQKHAYFNKLNKRRYAEFNPNSKKVNQYDLDGNFIKTWNSIIEASTKLNIKHSGICSCCIGIYKTSGGYKWKYTDKDTK